MFHPHRIDLAIYHNPPNPPLANVLSVGWLGETGAIPGSLTCDKHNGFVEKLTQLYRGEIPFTDIVAWRGGWYVCIFDCEHDLDKPRYSVHGIKEILIPGQGGLVYCAPGLLLHYITAHGYVPPTAFVNAVMAINEKTHFNATAYRYQLSRRVKGMTLLPYEDLVKLGFIEDGGPPPWWIDPAPYECVGRAVEPENSPGPPRAPIQTRYELEQIEIKNMLRLHKASQAASNTTRALASGQLSDDTVNETIGILREARRPFPEIRSAAIELSRLLRHANDSNATGLQAAIDILSETISALRQSAGAAKDEADLLYNRACYFTLLSQQAKDNQEDYLAKGKEDLKASILLHPDEDTKTLRRRYLDKIDVEPFPELVV